MKKNYLIMFSIFMTAAMTPPATSAQGGDRQELSAARQEQIRVVGKALLLAKRNVQHDEEVDLLREDVKKAHALLQKLMAPVGQRDRIQLAIPEKAERKPLGGSSLVEDEWLQAKAGGIGQLRQIFTSLDDRSQLIASQKKERKKETKCTLSDKVLSRLENLEGEMDEALLLPPDERAKRLKSLAAGLELNSLPGTLAEQERFESPTMITRTSHRRFGNN